MILFSTKLTICFNQKNPEGSANPTETDDLTPLAKAAQEAGENTGQVPKLVKNVRDHLVAASGAFKDIWSGR
jgi:hypothetical protein